MSAVPTGLRMNCLFRQPHAEARGKPLRLRRGRRAAVGMEHYYTGPFEGPPTIKPPALPEDIYRRRRAILRFRNEGVSEQRLGNKKLPHGNARNGSEYHSDLSLLA